MKQHSDCNVNLLSVCLNAFVYQIDADLASAANYAIRLMMLLVVNKGKYQVKHFKCNCWSVKHLPLPFWNIVIRLVLIFRRFFPAVLGFHPALTRRPPVLSKKRHCQDAKTSDNERKLDSVKLEKLLKWFSRALTAILYHVVNAFLMIKVRSCIYIVRRRIRKCSWSRPLWTAVTNTWLCLSFSSILQNLTRNIITRRVQYAAGSCVLIHLWNIIHSKSNLGTGVDPLLISPYD